MKVIARSKFELAIDNVAVQPVNLYSSSHMTSDLTWNPTLNAWRRYRSPESKQWLLEDPTSGNRILNYAMQAVLAVRKFVQPYHLKHLTATLPKSQSPCLLCVGVVKRETNKPPWNIKDELKARNYSNIYQFKQEHQKSLQLILKSSGDCDWNCLWFLSINLIYCISRYLHVILVNISDKLWYSRVIFFFA